MTNSRNKGFTLVELMVAIAISSIVIAMIAALMGSVSRNYKAANENVSLQMEAQTIINQLNQMIMESTNIDFSDIDGDSDKDLTIYQNDKGYNIILTFDKDNQELLFKKVYKVPTMGTPTNELFGQYVKEFLVIPSGSKGDTFEITLTLEQGGNSYSLSSKVRIRNKMIETKEDY